MNIFNLVSNGLIALFSLAAIGYLMKLLLKQKRNEEPPESEGDAFDLLVRRKKELLLQTATTTNESQKRPNLFTQYKLKAEQSVDNDDFVNVTKLMLELQWGEGPLIGEMKNSLGLTQEDPSATVLLKELFASQDYPIQNLPSYSQIRKALLKSLTLKDGSNRLATLLRLLMQPLPPKPE